ncbi:MAG: beta strand repeat-containing protein [Leptothrix sp. (in: b-proteobacteria)]
MTDLVFVNADNTVSVLLHDDPAGTPIVTNQYTATAINLAGYSASSTVPLSSFIVSALPANGTLYLDAGLTQAISTSTTITATGNGATIYFKPIGNWSGSSTFQYDAVDGNGNVSAIPATQQIVVSLVNDQPPVLSGSAATLPAGTEDLVMTLTSAQLLQGWTDPDTGQTLSVTGVTSNHGTVVNNGNGTWTLTPAANYNGALTFSYGVTDGLVTSNATLNTSLTAVNDPPALTAAATLAAGTEDTAYTVTAAQLLQGWTDVDSATLSVVNLTADHGTVTYDAATQTYTVTPTLNYNGALTLSYGVSDGIATVNTSLTTSLAAVNDPPALTAAAAALAAGTEDTAYAVTAAQLLQGWTDVDSANLTVTGLTADHGTVVDNLDGTYTVTPAANYNGALTFSYGVTDGLVTSNATLNTSLTAVNDPPALTAAAATLSAGAQDTPYTINASDLLAGWSDVDSATLAVANLSADHGSIVDNLDGSYTLTPTPGYNGAVTLSYQVSDGIANVNASLGVNLAFNAMVNTTQSYTMPAATGSNDQIDVVLSGSANVNAVGNTLANHLVGNSGNNVLDGQDGNDWIEGGAGNDALLGGATGNDTLDGGTGADWMAGGTGNDTYYVDNGGDVVFEKAGQGTDTVISTISYVLGANVENLTLAAAGGAIHGYGNALDNVITSNDSGDYLSGGAGNDTLTGGAGNDVLVGGTGADSMAGGAGNDTYYVDNTGDVVAENSNAGTDTVIAAISYTLGANIENLSLDATGGAINATGNDLNNVLIGNNSGNVLSGSAGNDALLGGTGHDTLDGGTGNDWMAGGAGNDTYHVDSAGDVVIENAGQGTDTVVSTISYVLGANVENLTLDAAGGAIHGYGNALDNVIIGNASGDYLAGGAGNDTLIGGSGNDTLVSGSGVDSLSGGAGNDTYYVNNAADVVTENASAGIDSVTTSVSYTLGANVENLTLDAAGGAIDATGNDANNVLTGNASDNLLSGGAGNDALLGGAGNDTLDGGAGNDWMAGDTGNDTYHVDSQGDVVIEKAGQGSDTVVSTISWILGANVENLTLDAAGGNINGFGNALDNVIVGNSGNNILFGGAGNDTLTGGGGNDLFVFNTSANATFNVDTITDFTASADHLEFDHAVFTSLPAYGASVQSGAGMTSVSSAHTFLAFDTSTGNLYYDADGVGAQTGVLIATLNGVSSLSANDVLVT